MPGTENKSVPFSLSKCIEQHQKVPWLQAQQFAPLRDLAEAKAVSSSLCKDCLAEQQWCREVRMLQVQGLIISFLGLFLTPK